MRKIVLFVLFHLAITFLGGCVELSKVMVTSNNQQMQGVIANGKSRVQDAQVQSYFASMGNMVIQSGRRLDHVDDPTFKRDELLDIYDKFDVYVVHDVAPNAFVAGDDYATINSSLIMMAESPEELVMVLGHEFGHLRHQHLVDHATRVQYGVVAAAVAQQVVLSQSKGSPESERQIAGEQAAAAALAICVPQTPEKENESDATGVEIMADLGLDLQYADDFFVRMLSLYGDASGSHPKPSERIARIGAKVAGLYANGYKPTRVLDRAEFLAMRDRVRQLVKEGVETKSIVYLANEMKEQSKSNSLLPPMGCGPLYADPSRTTEVFYRAAGVK
jgi:predicted Zn-dependent protease